MASKAHSLSLLNGNRIWRLRCDDDKNENDAEKACVCVWEKEREREKLARHETNV